VSKTELRKTVNNILCLGYLNNQQLRLFKKI